MNKERRMVLYTTVDGDTWDSIAKKVYGAERYADFLMECNMTLLDILVFQRGVVLETPALPQQKSVILPPWR